MNTNKNNDLASHWSVWNSPNISYAEYGIMFEWWPVHAKQHERKHVADVAQRMWLEEIVLLTWLHQEGITDEYLTSHHVDHIEINYNHNADELTVDVVENSDVGKGSNRARLWPVSAYRTSAQVVQLSDQEKVNFWKRSLDKKSLDRSALKKEHVWASLWKSSLEQRIQTRHTGARTWVVASWVAAEHGYAESDVRHSWLLQWAAWTMLGLLAIPFLLWSAGGFGGDAQVAEADRPSGFIGSLFSDYDIPGEHASWPLEVQFEKKMEEELAWLHWSSVQVQVEQMIHGASPDADLVDQERLRVLEETKSPTKNVLDEGDSVSWWEESAWAVLDTWTSTGWEKEEVVRIVVPEMRAHESADALEDDVRAFIADLTAGDEDMPVAREHFAPKELPQTGASWI